jgi:hypothetical protein
MKQLKRVILESPYAGNIAQNVSYALRCTLHSLKQGEAPFASHLLYTQMLSDYIPEQRKLGIDAGFAWGAVADYFVFYTDRGWSPGMLDAYERCKEHDYDFEFRALDGEIVLPEIEVLLKGVR